MPLAAILFISVCSTGISSIRTHYSRILRTFDFNLIDSNGALNAAITEPLYIKFNKDLEYLKITGSQDDIVYAYRGNYKKLMYHIAQIDASILDPYLISKEEWDKEVEKTYKNYQEIIEL